MEAMNPIGGGLVVVGFVVGLGVGLVVGLGVGFGVGLGVAFGAGFTVVLGGGLYLHIRVVSSFLSMLL